MRTKSNSAREAGRTRRLRLFDASLLLTLVLLTPVAARAQGPSLYDAPERLVINSKVMGSDGCRL